MGSRPIMGPDFLSESSRDQQSDEYRRIVAIDAAQNSGRDRHEREKDGGRYSPPRYEDRSRPYYPNEGSRDRARSPGYSTSRRSPPRDDFYDSREKIRDERQGSGRDDLRHELELRKRDDGRYPERRNSYERERERINEKRIELHRHEEHYERDRRRSDLSPPFHDRRRGSFDLARPRGDGWEREHQRERGGERRNRPPSREREDLRIRGNGREHFNEFDEVRERPRHFPYKPQRDFFKDDGFMHTPPIRGRGSSLPMRRGIPGSISRGRSMMRGSSRGFRGGPPFIRGGPPRGAFMRGGYIPRK